MIYLKDIINESKPKTAIITFPYKGQTVVIGPDNYQQCGIKIINWLYNNEYNFKFKSVFTNNGNFYTLNDVESKNDPSRYTKLENSDKYFLNRSGDFKSKFRTLKNMLVDFGINAEEIKLKGINENELDNKIKKPSEFMDNIRTPKQNPFGGVKNSSAICILGESGVGKSYRVEKTLENAGHEFEYIMPSSFMTNLLVQYKAGQGYVLNTLGKAILEANENPDKLYTIVFDECHKYINLINDEILQALSKKRNNGVRFISLDIETDQFFEELPIKNGRRIISDNLGFILASSKEEIVRENPDLKNRVDYITLTEGDREDNVDFAIDFLLSKIEKEKTNEGFSF